MHHIYPVSNVYYPGRHLQLVQVLLQFPAAIDAPVSSCLRRAVQRDAAAMQLCAVAVLQRKTASAKAARRRSKPAAFAMFKKRAAKDAAADDSDDAVVGDGFGAPQSRPSPMKKATDADRKQKARQKESPATAARRRSKNAAAMEHKRTADAAEWRSPQSRPSPVAVIAVGDKGRHSAFKINFEHWYVKVGSELSGSVTTQECCVCKER
jgi:hypothetical protein